MTTSIIIPSYLGQYKTAASNRESKLIRAINSALDQSHESEVILVSHGCQRTIDIAKHHFKGSKLRGIMVERTELWAGEARNAGIQQATGDWIFYLDSDDVLDDEHVEAVMDKVGNYDWVWFDDWRWSGQWKENKCHLGFGKCGTSNIAHKRTIGAWWPDKASYAKDDWNFIVNLKTVSENFAYIGQGFYYVCHLPRQSGKGYDI